MPDRHWLVALLACAAVLVVPLGSCIALSVLAPAPPPSAGQVRAAGAPTTPDPGLEEQNEAPPEEPAGPGYRAVAGTVSGSDGQPLVGARVWAEGLRGVSTTSGPGGRYRLGGVPVAAQTLRASAAGHVSGRAAAAPADGGSVTTVDFQLEAAPPVRGRVLTPDGDPAPDAMVRCVEAVDGEAVTTKADEEGTFELAPSAVGCDVVANLAGYGPSETAKADGGQELTLRLRALASISGIVEDGDRVGVAGVRVSVEVFNPVDSSASTVVAQNVRTDVEGRFLLPDLEAGRYVLTAERRGAPPTQSESIDVVAGEPQTGVRITLDEGGVAVGRVTDAEEGTPLGGAAVTLDAMSFTGGRPLTTRTDDDGNFQLSGVPQDRPFSLRVQAPGFNVRIAAGLEARGGEVRRDIALNPADGRPRREVPSVGFKVRSTREGLRVVQVTPEGPGAKAGLKSQDVIVSLDATSTQDMAQVEAVQRLRGEPGTRVQMVVRRAGQELTLFVEREMLIR